MTLIGMMTVILCYSTKFMLIYVNCLSVEIVGVIWQFSLCLLVPVVSLTLLDEIGKNAAALGPIT